MRQPDDWTEREAGEAQMLARINELELLLLDIKADLLTRSEQDTKGVNVVNLSGSIWHRLKKAVNQI
jgi:hypothetical protein